MCSVPRHIQLRYSDPSNQHPISRLVNCRRRPSRSRLRDCNPENRTSMHQDGRQRVEQTACAAAGSPPTGTLYIRYCRLGHHAGGTLERAGNVQDMHPRFDRHLKSVFATTLLGSQGIVLLLEQHYARICPLAADGKSGHVHPLQIHGGRIYLTASEYGAILSIDVLACVILTICVVVAARVRIRQKMRNNCVPSE